jgi:hypothetical protein
VCCWIADGAAGDSVLAGTRIRQVSNTAHHQACAWIYDHRMSSRHSRWPAGYPQPVCEHLYEGFRYGRGVLEWIRRWEYTLVWQDGHDGIRGREVDTVAQLRAVIAGRGPTRGSTGSRSGRFSTWSASPTGRTSARAGTASSRIRTRTAGTAGCRVATTAATACRCARCARCGSSSPYPGRTADHRRAGHRRSNEP